MVYRGLISTPVQADRQARTPVMFAKPDAA
jgi:hypothetical protein